MRFMRLLGFMGSPLSFFRVHWDHEPGRTVAQACCLWRRTGILPANNTCPNFTRFMESPLSLSRTHWDHEPVRIPLNRPPGTFSPTGGEGWDEGVRFMESPLSFFACIGTIQGSWRENCATPHAAER